MSTPTKKASPAIERFVMGVNETALADAWRKGELAVCVVNVDAEEVSPAIIKKIAGLKGIASVRQVRV